MKTIQLEELLNNYIEIKEALGKYGTFVVYKDEVPLFVLTPFKDKKGEKIEVMPMDNVIKLVKEIIKDNGEALEDLTKQTDEVFI